MLAFNKHDLIDYAAQNNLNYIIDVTNSSNEFDRNYIRNVIIPSMTQRWPAVVTNINKVAQLCNEQELILQPIILEKLASLQDSQKVLNLHLLSSFDQVWQKYLLRAWLQQFAITTSSDKLQAIFDEVINATRDANPCFVLAKKVLQRSRGKLYLRDQSALASVECVMSWNLEEDLLLPNGILLTKTNLAANQEFIAKLHSCNVTVKLGKHGRKAKKIFQEHEIPIWERAKYPLIFADNRLVCVVGLWLSPRF